MEKVSETPQTLVVDRWTIRVWHRARIVRWYRRRILGGEIVTDTQAAFALNKKDFRLWPREWRTLVEALEAWS